MGVEGDVGRAGAIKGVLDTLCYVAEITGYGSDFP